MTNPDNYDTYTLKAVHITPDDILTLRLLRDSQERRRMQHNTDKRLDNVDDKLLDTLNRILKQVE